MNRYEAALKSRTQQSSATPISTPNRGGDISLMDRLSIAWNQQSPGDRLKDAFNATIRPGLDAVSAPIRFPFHALGASVEDLKGNKEEAKQKRQKATQAAFEGLSLLTPAAKTLKGISNPIVRRTLENAIQGALEGAGQATQRGADPLQALFSKEAATGVGIGAALGAATGRMGNKAPTAAAQSTVPLPQQTPQIRMTDVGRTGQTARKEIGNVLDLTRKGAAATVEQAPVKPSVVPLDLTGPKLKVGGGEYSMERFGSDEDVKNLIRQTAKEAESQIKYARRGVVSWDQTMANSEEITIANVLNRKRGQAVNAEEVYAASKHTTALFNEVSELNKKIKQLEASGQPTDALRREVAQKGILAKQLIVETEGGSTELGRAFNAIKMSARDDLAPAQKLSMEVLKNEEKFKNIDMVMDRLMTFDPEDRIGMVKFLSESQYSDPAEKVMMSWYNSIFSGFTSQIANAVGNTARTTWHILNKPVAAGVDAARSAITGEPREVFLKETFPAVLGATRGIPEGVRRFLFAARTGFKKADVDNLEIPRAQLGGDLKDIFTGKAGIKTTLGTVNDVALRGLTATDELFRGVNRSTIIYERAAARAAKEGLDGDAFNKRVAEIVSAPDREITKYADEMATKMLFQDSNEMLSSAGKLREFAAFNVPVLGKVQPMRFVLPVIQTPYNVIKFGLEAGPLGLANIANKGIDKREYARRMSSAITGSMFMAGLAIYATEGKITGAVPRDKKERDGFYASGKQPWSVKVGDKWVSYQRVEPLNSWLSFIANAHESFEKNDTEPATEDIQQFLMAQTRNVMDQSFLAGLGSLYDAIEDPERYGGRFINNAATGFIPLSGALRGVARSQDTLARQPEGLGEALASNIPGLRQNVTPIPSEFEPGGLATEKAGGLQQIFSPVRVTQSDPEMEVKVNRTLIKKYREGARNGSVSSAKRLMQLDPGKTSERLLQRALREEERTREKNNRKLERLLKK